MYVIHVTDICFSFLDRFCDGSGGRPSRSIFRDGSLRVEFGASANPRFPRCRRIPLLVQKGYWPDVRRLDRDQSLRVVKALADQLQAEVWSMGR